MRELKAAERALKAEKPGKAGETKEIAACDLTRVRGLTLSLNCPMT